MSESEVWCEQLEPSWLRLSEKQSRDDAISTLSVLRSTTSTFDC